MRRTWFLVALTVVSLAGCVGTEQGEGYEVTMLVMPDGHPDAGREAFLRHGCSSCHAVSWDDRIPPPVTSIGAPSLDNNVSRTSPGMLATAIIAPSHYVPKKIRENADEKLSPMGDFTRKMTVRELIDVVSYLRAQGGSLVVEEAALMETR